MTWENIEPIGSSGPETVPMDGVRVRSCHALKGARWIAIRVGKDLAKAVSFHMENQKVRILFGTGVDKGRIAVAVDTSGEFVAKRRKSGEYLISINRQTAAGRFNLDFPPFAIDRCEVVKPENGQPPKFIFRASREMLDVVG